MVRLKQWLNDLYTIKSIRFNSTMVRLKPGKFAGVDDYIFEFQFHNGSIKTDKLIKLANHKLLFQFHNGSIKTHNENTQKFKQSLFQFHNGSIKTLRTQFYLICGICFNSTMVRLKQIEKKYWSNIHCRVSIPQWFD